MTAGQAIYSILKNNSGVNSIVGTGDNCRVFPLIDNQSYQIPFVTYENISTIASPTKSGVSTLDDKLYQINIVSNNPASTRILADAVRAALDYATTGDLQQCYFSDERDDWNEQITNDGACMIQQDYRLLMNR